LTQENLRSLTATDNLYSFPNGKYDEHGVIGAIEPETDEDF